MKIIGIDNGFTGAIAFIADGNNIIINDMPVITVGKKPATKSKPKNENTQQGLLEPDAVQAKKRSRPKVRHYLDLRAIKQMLSVEGDKHVFIEKSQPMSKGGKPQGVTATASYMKAYGQLEGLLVGMNIPYTEVTPQAWKKEMMAGMGKEKRNAVIRARQLFPTTEFLISKDGRADAVLIAEYGRRLLQRP